MLFCFQAMAPDAGGDKHRTCPLFREAYRTWPTPRK
ncbi:hypothetical protein GECvBMG_gp213c [Salmonella phage GEC_vB_MG]|nr:hypothetical protein GECvBMG_gp213c [Salmonella phage GEC_vB_MG]